MLRSWSREGKFPGRGGRPASPVSALDVLLLPDLVHTRNFESRLLSLIDCPRADSLSFRVCFLWPQGH